MDDSCIVELCDPDGLAVGQAIRLARAVSRIEPNLAPSMGAYVCHLADTAGCDERVMARALELLCAVSDRRSFTATCERVKETGDPVASAMVRWLEAGMERRRGRRSAPISPQSRQKV